MDTLSSTDLNTFIRHELNLYFDRRSDKQCQLVNGRTYGSTKILMLYIGRTVDRINRISDGRSWPI